jgi:hypothetical protein
MVENTDARYERANAGMEDDIEKTCDTTYQIFCMGSDLRKGEEEHGMPGRADDGQQ